MPAHDTRLNAPVARHHARAVRKAGAAAASVDRAVLALWRDALALLRDAPTLGLPRLHRQATALFRRLRPAAAAGLRDGLEGMVRWSQASAARTLAQSVPLGYLRRAAERRVVHVGPGGIPATMAGTGRPLAAREGRESRGGGTARPHGPTLVRTDEGREGHSNPVVSGGGPRPVLEATPGLLTLALTATGRLDLTSALTALSLGQQRTFLTDLLFPPPPAWQVQARVDRLIAPFLAAPRPDLVPPETLANVLVQQYAQGKTQQEIAETLLPHVQGVQASARRVARTWGIAVAADEQMQASEALGDLVVGYQIHSALVTETRPEHRKRHLTIYWREPKSGQKGFDETPRPPREADGSMAWN